MCVFRKGMLIKKISQREYFNTKHYKAINGLLKYFNNKPTNINGIAIYLSVIIFYPVLQKTYILYNKGK